MKTQHEIQMRIFEINNRAHQIISSPGISGSEEYERLTQERKALEWVLEDAP